MNPVVVRSQGQSPNDASEVIRSMIDRENELINHRIGWLTTTQGLFFATLGFAWDKPGAANLVGVMCFIGVMISIIHFVGLIAATSALSRLSERVLKVISPTRRPVRLA
jgi:hypothetical protein